MSERATLPIPTPPGEPSAAPAAPASLLPDAKRLAEQMASVAESNARRVEDLVAFLRTLLNARVAAWLPNTSNAAHPKADVIAAARGQDSGGVAALRKVLDPCDASVLPAPHLGKDVFTLVAPVRREGHFCGWLLAQLAVPNPRDLQAFLVLLQSFAGFMLYGEQRDASTVLQRVIDRASGLLEIFRKAGTELDFEKACAQAVESLKSEFGCSRVSLGYHERDRFRLRAISGSSKIDPRSPRHQPWEAAMQEAFSEGRAVEFTTTSPRTEETTAHEILQRETESARILTLPLPGRPTVLLLEWEEDDASTNPAHPDSGIAVAGAARSFLPVLFDLLLRARPNPVVFRVRRMWAKASEKKRQLWMGSIAAAAVLLAWPFHYPIRSSCRLAPVVKRVVAAPFEGQLRESRVRPGDRVEKDQPLGELDNRELRLREAELSAGRERALKQRDKAMANQGEGTDFAAAQVASLEARSIEQELALVQRRLGLLAVKSPISGVVVSGDLQRVIGQPVQRGQILWEVAPLEEMIVEIEVQSREISRVRTGMPVKVRLEAFGGETWKTKIERVHPRSEQRDGRNIFIAEATIRATVEVGADDLRPGLRGRATVESDRRPLIWILGHRLWDWIVTTLFW
jgi:multidrug resistance efflux pump